MKWNTNIGGYFIMNKKARFLITILLCIYVLCLFTGRDIKIANASGLTNPQTLVVWCHAVHEQFATGFMGDKIDVASEFEKKYNVKIEWFTMPFRAMQDKVLRQISMSQGEADVVFYLDQWAYRTNMGMFESLDAYMKEEPIEAIEDIPAGFWVTFSLDGQVKAFPYSSAFQILHYNKAYYKKFGLSEPPATLEDLVEVAKKTTFKREDGAQVYGLAAVDGDGDSTIIAFIRACGGEVLTPDFQVKINEKEAVYAVSLLRDLYQAGSIPPNYASIDMVGVMNMVFQGLISNVLHGSSYTTKFNDPEQSTVAGEIDVSYIPASKKTSFEVAPSKASFWGVGIPKNSPAEKKQLAYEFLRFFSGVDNQIKMALNNCSPFRISTFTSPKYSSKFKKVSSILGKCVPTAGQPIPSFGAVYEVYDIAKEQCFRAISGKIEVQAALDKAADLIEDVLKREGIK